MNFDWVSAHSFTASGASVEQRWCISGLMSMRAGVDGIIPQSLVALC
jgi:hypothetical protein